MSTKRIASILLVAFLSLAVAIPAAADDGGSSSLGNLILELVNDVVDYLTPDAPEESEDDNLPSAVPVIDPNG